MWKTHITSNLFHSLTHAIGMRNIGDAVLWDVMLCDHLKFMASHATRMCYLLLWERLCSVLAQLIYCPELPTSVHLVCFCSAHFTNAFWNQSWASWTQCWWLGSMTVLSQQKFTEATKFASQLPCKRDILVCSLLACLLPTPLPEWTHKHCKNCQLFSLVEHTAMTPDF